MGLPISKRYPLYEWDIVPCQTMTMVAKAERSDDRQSPCLNMRLFSPSKQNLPTTLSTLTLMMTEALPSMTKSSGKSLTSFNGLSALSSLDEYPPGKSVDELPNKSKASAAVQ